MNDAYADLEIRIFSLEEEGYPVQLTLRDGPDFPRGYLDPGFLPWVASGSPEEDGERLFGWLITGSHLSEAWAEVRGLAQGRRRIRLYIEPDAPELHAVPWELLREPGRTAGQGLDLAAASATPLSRYLPSRQPVAKPRLEGSLRVLVAIANPSNLEAFDVQPVDAEREWEIICQATAGLKVELVRLSSPCTPAALLAALQEGAHALHFVGHGAFSEKQGRTVLYMADADNQVNLVDEKELSDLFTNLLADTAGGDTERLQLVFLGSCETARRSPADAYRGLAPKLLAAGVPAAVAMQDRVPVVTAQAFARAFYRRLPRHGLVDLAANEARQAVMAGREPGASIPVLFMRMAEGQLLQVKTAAEAEVDQVPGPSPYKGLEVFGVRDAAIFFGREALTAKLTKTLHNQHFLAVIGASGSGKSSLVRAGLLPALQKGEPLADGTLPPPGSHDWPLHLFTPTAQPLSALASSLVATLEPHATVTERAIAAGKLEKALLARDVSLTGLSNSLLGSREHGRLLLVVDQFEELFTLCRDATVRAIFVENLLQAASAEGLATVILTMRADFYHHCSEFDELRQAVQDDQEYIGAMSEGELRRAIEKPARLGGWELEPGLVDLFLDDVAREPGALPLLSHALLETWQRREGRMLTFAGYYGSGRVQGAIAQTAESVYRQKLSEDERRIAKGIFLRLTELGEGAQDTRRRVPMSELVPAGEGTAPVETVLQLLQDARLVTASRAQEERDGGQADATIYVDVAHEALIREWGTLREWLGDDREGLRLLRHLTESAKEWEHLGHDAGPLYRGIQLERALAWAEEAENAGRLNELEQAFLEASRAERQRLIDEQAQLEREREEARQRDLEAAQALAAKETARREAEEQRAAEAEARSIEERRSRNRARLAFGAAAIAFILALVVGWFLYEQNQELQGARLLREAYDARLAREVEKAIDLFTQAAAADPPLGIDLEKETNETLRYAALALIYEGEALVREGDLDSATRKFDEALELEPPAGTPVYVWIEEGEFLMGSDPEVDSLAWEDEFPQHEVPVEGFWIMRTEVTNEQYRRCVEEGPCEEPGNERWKREEYEREPVTDVNWYEANVYAEWVGGRLPSEAEWEKACRGTEGDIYPWGNEAPNATRLNFFESGWNGPVPVGSYDAGAHGLYDMAGNVYEWTSSQYDQERYPYPYDSEDGREDPEGDAFRTLRGGSFYYPVNYVRCAHRFVWNLPDDWVDWVGFRVAVPQLLDSE